MGTPWDPRGPMRPQCTPRNKNAGPHGGGQQWWLRLASGAGKHRLWCDFLTLLRWRGGRRFLALWRWRDHRGRKVSASRPPRMRAVGNPLDVGAADVDTSFLPLRAGGHRCEREIPVPWRCKHGWKILAFGAGMHRREQDFLAPSHWRTGVRFLSFGVDDAAAGATSLSFLRFRTSGGCCCPFGVGEAAAVTNFLPLNTGEAAAFPKSVARVCAMQPCGMGTLRTHGPMGP